ncbi:hypothetical protein NEUTE2DRAFT_164057 [Neurospora tetrasperma FGSC 2509]|nr:hypothetical protein NEUTE2DRAFT_164057 [Neurospora tetrasperma FGSC 2509]
MIETDKKGERAANPSTKPTRGPRTQKVNGKKQTRNSPLLTRDWIRGWTLVLMPNPKGCVRVNMAIDFEDAAHGLEADNNCGIVARLLVGESDEEEEEEEEEEEGDGFDAFIGLKPAVAGGCEVLFGEHFGLVGVYLFNTVNAAKGSARDKT